LGRITISLAPASVGSSLAADGPASPPCEATLRRTLRPVRSVPSASLCEAALAGVRIGHRPAADHIRQSGERPLVSFLDSRAGHSSAVTLRSYPPGLDDRKRVQPCVVVPVQAPGLDRT